MQTTVRIWAKPKPRVLVGNLVLLCAPYGFVAGLKVQGIDRPSKRKKILAGIALERLCREIRGWPSHFPWECCLAAWKKARDSVDVHPGGFQKGGHQKTAVISMDDLGVFHGIPISGSLQLFKALKTFHRNSLPPSGSVTVFCWGWCRQAVFYRKWRSCSLRSLEGFKFGG